MVLNRQKQAEQNPQKMKQHRDSYAARSVLPKQNFCTKIQKNSARQAEKKCDALAGAKAQKDSGKRAERNQQAVSRRNADFLLYRHCVLSQKTDSLRNAADGNRQRYNGSQLPVHPTGRSQRQPNRNTKQRGLQPKTAGDCLFFSLYHLQMIPEQQ